MLVMGNILNGTSNVKKKRNPIPVKTRGRKKKKKNLDNAITKNRGI